MHLIRILCLHFPEEVLVQPLAAAQYHEPAAQLQHFLEGLLYQLDALVCHETGHNAHYRRIGIGQTAFMQQGSPALFFAGDLGHGIMLFQVGVRLRVIAHDVNAVEDTHNAVLPPHQSTIHAVGIPRVEDLFRIGGADSGDTVCCFNSAFHQIHHAVKFQQAGVIGGNAHQLCDNFLAVNALVLDVVDGVDDADVLEFLVVLIEDTVEHRHHSRLPVVAVDDVRFPVQRRQNFQHGTAEKDKAFAVVVKAVHSVPHEIIRVVQQVIGHFAHLDGVDAAVLLPPAHFYGDILEIGHLVADSRGDAPVQGHNNTAVDLAVLAQRSRQGASHICQTAGCGKGQCLAGSK